MNTGLRRRTKQTIPSVKLMLDSRRFTLLQHLAADMAIESSQLARVWLSEKIDQVAAAIGDEASRTGAAPAFTRRSMDRDEKPDRLKVRLHDEIAAVLDASGRPMSVAEIAAEIRQRAMYRPPRSKLPIGTAAISSRISNPHYRALFHRSGRAVTLAHPPK